MHVIKNKKIGRAYSTRQDAYWLLVGKSEQKRPLQKLRNRRKVIINIDLQGVKWDLDWIDLSQDMNKKWVFVSTVRDRRIPQIAGNLKKNLLRGVSTSQEPVIQLGLWEHYTLTRRVHTVPTIKLLAQDWWTVSPS